MSKRIDDEIGKAITKDNKKWASKSSKYLARVRYDMRRVLAGLCRYPNCHEPRALVNGREVQWCEVHRAYINGKQTACYAKRKASKARILLTEKGD